MKNLQKSTMVALAGLVLIMLGAVGFYIYSMGMSDTKQQTPLPNPTYCGLTITSIAQNATITFPITISGTLDISSSQTQGCTWQRFEGQAGTVQVFALQNNIWKAINEPQPVPVANWMEPQTTFAVTINPKNLSISNGTPIKIRFTEEDAAGMGNAKTLDLMGSFKSF